MEPQTPEEFAKLMENKLKLTKMGLRDQYNSNDNELDSSHYENVVHGDDTLLNPKTGETFFSYYQRLTVIQKYSETKSYKAHIAGPKGAWYSHRSPLGCFMCEDQNLIRVLLDVLGLIISKHQTDTF